MKVGDLVENEDYGTGIIVDVVDQQWDPDLPGYVEGGETFKVSFSKDYYFFSANELKTLSES